MRRSKISSAVFVQAKGLSGGASAWWVVLVCPGSRVGRQLKELARPGRIRNEIDYSRGPEKTWVYGALHIRDGQELTMTATSRNSVFYQ